ncbi:type II toxin-antitoxin system HicB family antitoxin [Paenibacillus chitinolyticus]
MPRKDSFIYPVVIESADDGVGLYFPDLPGTAIMAADTVTGIKNAKEMMIDRIIEMEDKGLPIPDPSNPENIELYSPTDRIVYLDVYLPPYRDEAANKSVTKNCTLPKWLRDASEDAGLNFSLVLQSGLKEALGIKQSERP